VVDVVTVLLARHRHREPARGVGRLEQVEGCWK
jgi:hypothetical protein